jgi:hypothetical protein
MSFEITEAFQRQYNDSFLQVYQQTQSMLEGTVRKDTQQAEYKFWDFIGQTSGNWDRASNSDTTYVSTPHTRRGNKQRVWTWAELTDDLDVIQALKDPTSAYIQAAVAAAGRAKDERILERLGATVLTGKDGTVTVNMYDVNECRVMQADGTLAAAGSAGADTTATGLTLAKIATIGGVFDNASIPATDRHIVANTDQKWSLLGTTKVTSSDYNTVKALTNGELNTFMGFQFHWLPADRFTLDTTEIDSYLCYAYHRDAVLMTTGKNLVTRVTEMPTKNYSVQAYAEMFIGAVRLQGPGVMQVKLLASPSLSGLYA